LFAALAVFYLVGLSPEQYWIFGFIGYTIPLLLLIHVFFLIYFILRKSWKLILPVIVFIIGWPHLRSTIQFHSKHEFESNSSLKVINYNVRVFNVYDHLKGSDPDSLLQMLDWLANQEATVLSLQEYYNDNSSDVYNINQRLKRKGYNYSYVNANKENRIGAQFGLAIFSKLPIINKGVIAYGNEPSNQSIYVDVRLNDDTVRIFNVHLHSMKLRVNEFVREEREIRKLVKLKENIKRIKEGFVEHSKETDILQTEIRNSNHPVILTGDFNDVPYSYTYLTFRDFLQNSFEEAGNGFGFTYNEAPYFIRIDNQFSSTNFEVISHKVHDEVPYSDHYPVSVNYRLNKK
jgi:endonuclease/exonuclease/phosphatase family metal-dependent hydrolase